MTSCDIEPRGVSGAPRSPHADGGASCGGVAPPASIHRNHRRVRSSKQTRVETIAFSAAKTRCAEAASFLVVWSRMNSMSVELLLLLLLLPMASEGGVAASHNDAADIVGAILLFAAKVLNVVS